MRRRVAALRKHLLTTYAQELPSAMANAAETVSNHCLTLRHSARSSLQAKSSSSTESRVSREEATTYGRGCGCMGGWAVNRLNRLLVPGTCIAQLPSQRLHAGSPNC